MGEFAAGNVTGGTSETALGFKAGQAVSTGASNTAIGALAMQSGAAITGANNTAVGANALFVLTGAAANNTAIGVNAGSTATTATQDVLIGSGVAPGTIAGTNEIVIGSFATGAGSNTTTIGTTSTTDTYFGGATALSGVHAAKYFTSGTHILISGTAPTIASGFGTSPSIPNNNGTAAFTVNVGTGGAATSGVLTMPAATTGWVCMVTPNGAPQAAGVTYSAPTSTTSVTLTNYTASTGAALAWSASYVLQVSCHAY
jgi:hypothetical protein